MAEPKIHVLRAQLPWRPEDPHTECGLIVEGHQVLTRHEAVAKWKEWGVQRMALLLCMTCKDTANRWPLWEEDPVAVMQRETTRSRWGEGGDREQLKFELMALAALAVAHPEEFRATVKGLQAAPSLAAARSDRRARRHFRGY